MAPGEIINREQFGEFLNRLGLLGAGIEIGSDKGAFAHALLSRWHGGPLVCVDPYETCPMHPDCPETGRDRSPDLACFTHVMSWHLGRIQLLRMTSEAASKHTQVRHIGKIQFVYIDGDHSHDAVMLDLVSWYRLLEPGGLMAGHDWNIPDVQRAVSTFVLRSGAGSVSLVSGDATSWYFRKPEK